MATRFFITLTFIGDESEAPEDWQLGAIASVSSQINRGYTSGEITVYDEDRAFRAYWEIKAEDE